MSGALPAPLRAPSAFPFAGRERELAALRTMRRLALIGGDAGSGKSRLVREFVRDVEATVLYGACDPVVRAPYGAFAEALGGLPEVAGAADPDTARHRLHLAVAERLERAAPVILVLEDIHWADTAALALLRHLARAGGRAHVLATFRDTDVPDALAEALVDLRRSEDLLRLRLAGLSAGEVAELAGAPIDPALAGAIAELTAGNAFLVCELWRALVEAGAVGIDGGVLRARIALSEVATPESVREVSLRRLARLRPATAESLELAAVAGDRFGVELAVEGADLDEAVRSGLIEELPARRLTYRFAHVLVRRALYDSLPGVRRAELHLRVALALAGASNDRLAPHFTAAAALTGPALAVDYNVRAARDAADALAFAEAEERLTTALELGVADRTERFELLLFLGEVRHKAGRAVDALRAFADAAAEAESPAELARTAIGYEEACWRPNIVDTPCVELLERAAAALGEEPSELRVGVLGGLSRALLLRGERSRGGAVREQAIAMARSLGADAALAKVLAMSGWARATVADEDVLTALGESAAIAERLGAVDLHGEARNWRAGLLVSLCRLDAAREEVAAVRGIAERTAQPFLLHVAEHTTSAIALCQGRLEDAEAAARRAHECSLLLTGRDASGVHGIQMFGVRREQGRLAELAGVVRLLADGGGRWQPGLAALLCELGELEEARRVLARVAERGLDDYRASLWVASLAYLADAVTTVGDTALAELLYAELSSLAGGNVVIGHVVACYGAADRYLGMLAATLGRADAAAEHFERALALNRRMGADTWLAHTAYEYATLLGPRGADLLAQASALARRIGLVALQERIAGAVTPPDGLSPREVQILALVAEGCSNREIGARLVISEHTAANHVRSILRKTGCSNRTEAASYAHRHALVGR
jgi:DNA-binding CsgD family transcriptional regulator